MLLSSNSGGCGYSKLSRWGHRGPQADLVEYLLLRRDEPCDQAIAELVMKAATAGRLAWAIKDKIVEALSTGAPVTKRAQGILLLCR